MRIGITLTSSLSVGQEYIELTRAVATRLASEGFGIVYGGTAYGMMATLGESYKQAGGNDLTGVMAKDLMAVTKHYVAFENLDHTFVEDTMESRKYRITRESDGFIILPGGYGTFEEIGSIIGGKVNKLYDKPIVIFNYHGFYDTLIAFLSEMQAKNFSKIPISEFVYVTDSLDEAIGHLKQYHPKELADKFV